MFSPHVALVVLEIAIYNYRQPSLLEVLKMIAESQFIVNGDSQNLQLVR